MNRALATAVFVSTLAALASACRDAAPPAAPQPPAAALTNAPAASALLTNAASSNKVFIVKGIVDHLKENGRIAVIKHEAIPDYMEAMTMPFTVKEPADLRNLLPGATVLFRLVVTEDDSWIQDVALLGGSKLPETPALKSFRLVRDVEPLKVGDAMPDYRFTNELGRAVSFADYKGRPYAFSFIFTRCPLPDFCPRMNQNFSKALTQLKASPAAPTNVHLFSISFDVGFDSPAVLLNYARRHSNYDPQQWSFLTGALIDIDAVTEQFGLVFRRESGRIDFDHNLRTVVVNSAGKIQAILIGNTWKPDELASELVKAAAVK